MSSKIETVLRPRVAVNRDTRFFWDGLKQGKLLIQKCSQCGELRHPPGPMCPKCNSLEWETLESSGKGIILSFVKMHHPALPAFDKPNPIGLIELEEGTRLVGGLIGFESNKVAPNLKIDKEIKIGQLVEAVITKCDEELNLVLFRPREIN